MCEQDHLKISAIHFYRPQTKYGQGNVFTGICLSTGGSSVHKGVSVQGVSVRGGGPLCPGGGLCPGGLSVQGLCHPDPPRTVMCVGGMHPTGMNSCKHLILLLKIPCSISDHRITCKYF